MIFLSGSHGYGVLCHVTGTREPVFTRENLSAHPSRKVSFDWPHSPVHCARLHSGRNIHTNTSKFRLLDEWRAERMKLTFAGWALLA